MISQNHMQKIKKFVIRNSAFLIVFMLLIMPALSFGANGDSLVHCGVTSQEVLSAHPEYAKPCDFNGIMDLVNTVIKFVLFDMVIPIAAIMFFYAGFLMVTAGGEAAGARTKAKSIFTNVVIGLILAMAAWLIIRMVLSILGYKGDWIGFSPF
jgi:hypothetical protein